MSAALHVAMSPDCTSTSQNTACMSCGKPSSPGGQSQNRPYLLLEGSSCMNRGMHVLSVNMDSVLLLNLLRRLLAACCCVNENMTYCLKRC